MFWISTIDANLKKRRKTYRIEIKNSLIQIDKNKIRKIILNYISYYFERITDVEKQEGIGNDYTENYIFLLMTKNMKKKKIKKIKMKFGVERSRDCLGIKDDISWINIFLVVAVSEVGFFMYIHLSLTICP